MLYFHASLFLYKIRRMLFCVKYYVRAMTIKLFMFLIRYFERIDIQTENDQTVYKNRTLTNRL